MDVADSKKRPRYEVTFAPDDYEWIRVEGARVGKSPNEWLHDLAQESRNRQQAEAELRAVQDAPDAKSAFVKAVRSQFFIEQACRMAHVERPTVRRWLAEDYEFMENFSDAQECFIESIEQQLLAIGLGKVKGNPLPLITFLNSHHPQYGRFKAEMLSRILGPMMERFYKVVKQVASKEIADRINTRMKEIAAKKLSEFTD